MAYPNGDRIKRHMSLYLEVARSKHLPSGWRRHTKLCLTVVNQLSEELSQVKQKYKWFDQKTPASGFLRMIPYSKLFQEKGFVVNGELKIVVNVDVFRVIGKSDVSEKPVEISEDESKEISEEKSNDESEDNSEEKSDDESEEKSSSSDSSEEAISPQKKTKLNEDGAVSSDLHKETQLAKEVIDVNGFQVLPSQVGFVTRLLGKHRHIAVDIRTNNPHLRKGCMNSLLSLIETLCQSPQKLTDDDLVEADIALTYVKDSGFKVDWLEKKLQEVKQKKKEEQTSETRIQKLEKELKDSKQKCLDIEALLEKEKAKLLATRAPLTLDDFV